MKNIYDLKLNEKVDSDDDNGGSIMRVPGGWIYTLITYIREEVGGYPNGTVTITARPTSVFVPLNSEFKRREVGDNGDD